MKITKTTWNGAASWQKRVKEAEKKGLKIVVKQTKKS